MLHAQKRTPGVKLNVYRKEGKLPAVLYGHGFDSVPLFLESSEFVKLIRAQGKAGLLDLQVDDDESVKVLLQDYQAHPITQLFIHVDLYRIRMDEKLRTTIPLVFYGDSPATKQGGILLKNYTEVEVECLPQDLISEIKIDLSALKNIHDSVKVENLVLPQGFTLLADKGEVLVTVTQQAAEEKSAGTTDEKAQVQAKIEELGKEPEKEDKEKKED